MSPDPLPTGPFSEVLISVSLWYAAASIRGSAAFRRSVRRTLPSMWTVVVIIARARRSLADGLRSCRPHCTACTRRYALDHSARRNLPPGKSWVVRNLDKLDLVAYREKRLGRDKVPCSCARNDGTGSRGRGRNRLHEMHHRALRMFADRAFEGAQIVARCMGLNVCQHHCHSALRARWARDRPRRRMG